MSARFSIVAASIVPLVLVATAPAMARRHHVSRPRDRGAEAAPRQSTPPVPTAGEQYRNHIVEDGMTQDQLDRATGR